MEIFKILNPNNQEQAPCIMSTSTILLYYTMILIDPDYSWFMVDKS